MVPYKYKPLDAYREEIRLLKILPGQFADRLETEMFHVPFSSADNPSYEALSYVWGSTDNPSTISIRDGSTQTWLQYSKQLWSRPKVPDDSQFRDLSITLNLAIALKHLRDTEKPRILWIDAICINQEDFPERSAQVYRMGSIYRIARQVSIWLGPRSSNSDLAMKVINELSQSICYVPEEHFVQVTKGTKVSRIEDDVVALREMEKCWVAIRDLFRREWFTRLWVFQELHLATDIMVITGLYQVSWGQLLAVFYWIFENGLLRGLDFFTPGDLLNVSAMVDRLIKPSGLTFQYLLARTNDLSCADPRDRIYALLNLLPEKFRLGIIPDYSRSIGDVYMDLVLRYAADAPLPQVHHLRLCVLGDTKEMPTWVPDFSKPRPTLFYISLASGRSRQELLYSGNGILRVRGVTAVEITHIGDAISDSPSISDLLAMSLSWAPSNLSSSYVGGGTLLDAYITLLVGGNTAELQPEFRRYPSLHECREAFSRIQDERFEGIHAGFLDLLMETLKRRRFFVTSQGYIGLGPKPTMLGDIVCVVLGCSSPLLLRRVVGWKDHYEVVGECYVHGLMFSDMLLGRLPRQWSRQCWVNGDDQGISYIFNGGQPTLEDPRLGPLPPEWRIRYGLGQALKTRGISPEMSFTERCLENIRYGLDWMLRDQERDEAGNIRERYFENLETGEHTWADPRLTSEALKADGIDVKDFFLI